VSPSRHRDSWLSEQVGSRRRFALSVLAAGALAIGASAGVAWAAGFDEVRRGLLHPNWPWLAVAFVGQMVAYLGYTLAYREVVRAEGGTQLEAPKAAAIVATGFGVFIHAGGFSLDRAALERAGLSQEEARARVLGLGALEYTVLAPATAIAAGIVYFNQSGVSASLTLPWLVGVPAGFGLAFLVLRVGGRFRPARSGWRRRLGHCLDALDLTMRLVCRPRAYGLGLAGMTLYWVGDVFCLWAALHVFYAHSPPVAQLIVGYATGYALTRRTLPLGGAGVVEALLPFALGWVAIGLAPAVLAVVAYRLLNLWLPLFPALAGLPALRALGRSPRHAHARGR
jgi:uncharacterized membrane protein YbhN (UPF0104 family)